MVYNDCPLREPKTFTGSDWTDARNYDMTLNVRRFGVNGAVDFILQSIE